jgi:NAD(P)-dependent dehydrogenase (short-subunit alcohol dehydrogenase family)
VRSTSWSEHGRRPRDHADAPLRQTRVPMVAFLMSDDAEWINGQVLSVDGGATMR